MLVRSTAEAVTQHTCMWFLHVAPASLNMKAELWQEAAEVQVFQEAGAEAAGPVEDEARTSPVFLLPYSTSQSSHSAFPDLRGCKNRCHLLMREWQVNLACTRAMREGWEISQQCLENVIDHIGIVRIFEPETCTKSYKEEKDTKG